MVCSTYLFIPYSISFDVTYKHTTVQKENNNWENPGYKKTMNEKNKAMTAIKTKNHTKKWILKPDHWLCVLRCVSN